MTMQAMNYETLRGALDAAVDAFEGMKDGVTKISRADAIARIKALGFSEADAERWCDRSRERKPG